jgi:hypothetical protein
MDIRVERFNCQTFTSISVGDFKDINVNMLQADSQLFKQRQRFSGNSMFAHSSVLHALLQLCAILDTNVVHLYWTQTGQTLF